MTGTPFQVIQGPDLAASDLPPAIMEDREGRGHSLIEVVSRQMP
jgi:hypothetical protein